MNKFPLLYWVAAMLCNVDVLNTNLLRGKKSSCRDRFHWNLNNRLLWHLRNELAKFAIAEMKQLLINFFFYFIFNKIIFLK